MEQSKIRTYFFYAIGEIALVMIGILLALQVNNWNEERKNRNYELKILSEVQGALQNDIQRQYRDLEILSRAERSTRILTQYRNGKQPRPDSILQHIDYVNIRRFFQTNDGPYEAIKSGGMDRISNDSLRTMLSNIYDNVIPSVTYMYNQVLSDYIDANQTIINTLFTAKMIVNDEGELYLNVEPPTPEQVQDPRFDQFLRNSVVIQNYGHRNILWALAAMEELEALLSVELGGINTEK